MVSISEDYKSRSIQSVRVNDKLTDICKQTGIPLSNVVESCLVHFATLKDEERLELLNTYTTDKVDSQAIVEPALNIAEQAVTTAKESLGKKADGTSTKMLLAIGLGILALMLTKE